MVADCRQPTGTDLNTIAQIQKGYIAEFCRNIFHHHISYLTPRYLERPQRTCTAQKKIRGETSFLLFLQNN